MAFRLLTSEKAVIFQMISSSINSAEAESCRTEISNVMAGYSLIVLDFTKVAQIDSDALLALSEVSKKLVPGKQRLMVTVSQEIATKIRSEGLGQLLPCYVGVGSIVDMPSESPLPEMNGTRFLKSSVAAVLENLRTYAKVEAKCEEPVPCSMDELADIDIVGVAGFSCDSRKGNLMLGFRRDSYLKTVSAIMKKPISSVEFPFADWAGELTNSVLGRIKVELKGQGYAVNVGIPVVYMANDLAKFRTTQVPVSMDKMLCKGSFGEISVAVVFS